MQRLLLAGALAAFCVFWFVSTPIYFLTSVMVLINKHVERVDARLSRLLDELWKGIS